MSKKSMNVSRTVFRILALILALLLLGGSIYYTLSFILH